MSTDDFDEADEAAFTEALARRDAGEIHEAIRLLRDLAMKRPRAAFVAGILASLLDDIGDFEGCLHHARDAVALAPRSGLASRTLFHVLIKLGDVGAAFREAARFRSIKRSVEYDRLLAECENDTLVGLEKAPLDAFLRRLLAAVREEVMIRPIKQ